MRILITGASGLLGINLALEIARGLPSARSTSTGQHTVFGVTNSQPLITSDFTVLQTDLLAPGAVERLLDDTQPDWVIHCAALANVDACEADPAWAEQLNTELPRKLALNVARGGARLVHISTDCVFDGARGNYQEQDLPNPLGVYASTKLAGEHAVQETDPSAIIARVNLFGWSLTARRSLAELFFYTLSAGKRMMGFTDVYFCPLLANDMAQIFLAMLERKLSGIYHVVSRQCLSKYEFGVRLAHRFDLDPNLIQPTPVAESGLRAARSPNLSLRTEKLTQALGFPPPDISAGLEHFYQLYQQGYPQELVGFSRGSEQPGSSSRDARSD
jgi:dTDP-4-dehydrorhamnose reductase